MCLYLQCPLFVYAYASHNVIDLMLLKVLLVVVRFLREQKMLIGLKVVILKHCVFLNSHIAGHAVCTVLLQISRGSAVVSDMYGSSLINDSAID